MTTQQIARWYFLASGCFWSSLISVHGFLVLTAKDHFGLSPESVTFPLILVHLAVVLLEVPTGAVADSWSRARSAGVGQLLVALSLAFLPTLKNTSGHQMTAGLFVFAVLFAAGWSFFSGSLKGLVSQHIRENEPSLMPWFVKTSSACNNVGILCVTLFYPVMYGLHWKLVWYSSSGLAFLSLLLSLPLIRFERQGGERQKRVKPWESIHAAFLSFKNSPRLVSLSLVSVILFSLATTFESTLQTHAAAVAGFDGTKDAASWRDFITPAWFAWFFLSLGSLSASWFDFGRIFLGRFQRFDQGRISLVVIAAVISAYALLAHLGLQDFLKSIFLGPVSFSIGWLITLLRNENASELQSAIVDGKVTSTVLSINSLSQDLLSAVFLGIFALLQTGAVGIPWSWALLSVGTVVAVSWITERNLRPEIKTEAAL